MGMVMKKPEMYRKYFSPHSSASFMNKSARSWMRWKYLARSASSSATLAGSLQMLAMTFMAALLEFDQVARLVYWLMATNSSAISLFGVTQIMAPIRWPYMVKPLLQV